MAEAHKRSARPGPAILERRPLPDSAREAAHATWTVVGQLRRRLLALGKGDELTPAQVSALTRIVKADATTARALAEIERVSPQAIGVTLGVLEQRGFIRRTTDPGDRRRQIIEPTGHGREHIAEARGARRAWLEQAFADELSEGERRTILDATALLQRIAETGDRSKA